MGKVLQVIVFVALFLFLFGPVLLRIWRWLSAHGLVGGGRVERNRRRDLPPRAGDPAKGAYCPYCGKPIPVDSRFCCQCGRDVSFIDV